VHRNLISFPLSKSPFLDTAKCKVKPVQWMPCRNLLFLGSTSVTIALMGLGGGSHFRQLVTSGCWVIIRFTYRSYFSSAFLSLISQSSHQIQSQRFVRFGCRLQLFWLESLLWVVQFVYLFLGHNIPSDIKHVDNAVSGLCAKYP